MIRIAVVTGTRAEFGLLEPLLEKIIADVETELQLIVTGMHLSPEFGMTIDEIRESGYDIADQVEILLSSDSSVGTTKSVGLATIGFADSLRRLTPDWLVVLGDRFEILAAATAGMLMGVPIAHLHGGERTEGLIDEPIRHSVTKMSAVHFASTPEYQRRIVQLGEPPDRVHYVGAIGLDRIDPKRLMTRTELVDDLGIDSDRPWCTVTFHPVTLEPRSARRDVESLIGAMERMQDLFFIITKANADESGRLVNRTLGEFASRANNAVLHDSLGSKRYLSCVAESELVLGNSSSAIIEAPYLRTPTVDIGIRQKGRARGESVIHCDVSESEIIEAVEQARELTNSAIFKTSPYYNGGASKPILRVLKTTSPNRVKTFHDVDFVL